MEAMFASGSLDKVIGKRKPSWPGLSDEPEPKIACTRNDDVMMETRKYVLL